MIIFNNILKLYSYIYNYNPLKLNRGLYNILIINELELSSAAAVASSIKFLHLFKPFLACIKTI